VGSAPPEDGRTDGRAKQRKNERKNSSSQESTPPTRYRPQPVRSDVRVRTRDGFEIRSPRRGRAACRPTPLAHSAGWHCGRRSLDTRSLSPMHSRPGGRTRIGLSVPLALTLWLRTQQASDTQRSTSHSHSHSGSFFVPSPNHDPATASMWRDRAIYNQRSHHKSCRAPVGHSFRGFLLE